jgi:DNA repair photolyase
VHAGVFLAPVLPAITDDMENLRQVSEAAADSGAKFLGTQMLHLQPGTRDHFFGCLHERYPDLVAE